MQLCNAFSGKYGGREGAGGMGVHLLPTLAILMYNKTVSALMKTQVTRYSTTYAVVSASNLDHTQDHTHLVPILIAYEEVI